ncbi:MAG: dicarboxylate/amino acid:cation symporter [Rickettsiales bacterium TMED254]|nr:dicarboxylate/amino acid:cation symporter [Rickettsiales bacterium]RPF76321.1 MAG: dicarboxylate/amino acid:cation symporter [Rickettsiales bacterium TMED254]
MKKNLTRNILIAFILGILIGIFLNYLELYLPNIQKVFVNNFLSLGGEVFLKTLKMLVVPIVFCSLICGICGLKDFSSLGRISFKTITLYITTTSIAISLALFFAYLIQPGQNQETILISQEINLRTAPNLSEVFLNIIPSNPFKALVEGNMLQVIFFSIILGSSISLIGKKGENIKNFFFSLNDIFLKGLELIMVIAPLGIFCLISKTFATQGLDIIFELAKYFFTVVFVLFIHMFFIYGSMVKLICNINPFNFFRKIKEAMFFAFSTSSSSATIPITLRNVEANLGVKKKIASFTVPLGSTINMDGTAIMQGVATVFIANIYGYELFFTDFITIIITATLASIGTAGVPGVGLIMLGMVLSQIGLPLEGIAIVMGVDRFLDMLRTSTNVSGDAAISLIINKSEK